MPAYPYQLFVRGSARAGSADGTVAVPAYVDYAGGGVVLRRPLSKGYVTVLSSSTLLANDGLGEAELADERLDGADAAVGDRSGLCSDLVVDVGRGDDRVRRLKRAEAPCPRVTPSRRRMSGPG